MLVEQFGVELDKEESVRPASVVGQEKLQILIGILKECTNASTMIISLRAPFIMDYSCLDTGLGCKESCL